MTRIKLGSSVRWILVAGICGVLLTVVSAQSAWAQQAAATRTAVAMDVPPASALSSIPSTLAAPPFNALPQGAAKSASVAKGAEREETAARPESPGAQGLKVHGHWVMDVKNKDGKVVEHRDFQNSLTTVASAGSNGISVTGDQILAGLLSGSIVTGDPGIGFIQDTNTSVDPSLDCGSVAALSLNCFLFSTPQSLLGINQATLQTGLTISVTFLGGPSGAPSWVLSGNYTVPAGLTSIVSVATMEGFCYTSFSLFSNGVGPFSGGSFNDRSNVYGASICSKTNSEFASGLNTATGSLTFTPVMSGGVPKPLSVTAGQIITVTVTITFS
jgi:hypothetical protein